MPVLENDGHAWHYEQEDGAQPDAVPLVLVHGATANLHIWDTAMEALRAHFHVYRPDLLGHGRSAKPAEPEAYSVPGWAEGLHRLFDHWGLERAVLMGHSLGGMVVQEFAVRWPERLTALGLLATTPGLVVKTEEDRAREDALVEFVRTQGVKGAWETNLRMNPFADRLKQLPGGLDRLAAEYNLNTVESMVNTRLSLRTKPRHTPHLAGFTFPTAVFVGEHDADFQVGTDVLARKIPGAVKYVIPDAGHSPQLENPAVAAEIITRGLVGLLNHLPQG